VKVCRVLRTDRVDYEEFIEAVAIAQSPVEALVLVGDKYGVRKDFSNVSVEEVQVGGSSRIICESGRGA
jgi:hypothetical protein